MEPIRLILFVDSAATPVTRVIAEARAVCEVLEIGVDRLEVVDLAIRPDRAAAYDVLATPTLVRAAPLPVRKIVGDLSLSGRVADGLGLTPPSTAAEE